VAGATLPKPSRLKIAVVRLECRSAHGRKRRGRQTIANGQSGVMIPACRHWVLTQDVANDERVLYPDGQAVVVAPFADVAMAAMILAASGIVRANRRSETRPHQRLIGEVCWKRIKRCERWERQDQRHLTV
jgi:hypothetical protein